jgi:hypothetical protein
MMKWPLLIVVGGGGMCAIAAFGAYLIWLGAI